MATEMPEDGGSGDQIVEANPSVPPLALDATRPDLEVEPSAPDSDGQVAQPDDSEAEDAVVDAASAPVMRGFVNPWGRTVPVLSNVSGFVDKNWPAAERLARQIPGLTPEQVLTALGSENAYGSDPKASQYGNYAGIHFDPSRGQKGYFPGQTGVFITQGVYDSKSKKFVHRQPMAQFPTDKGFEMSGQVLVNRLKPFVPPGGIADSRQFFQLIHDHGWGTNNDAYMDGVSGRYGSYWLVRAAAKARKAKQIGQPQK